MNSIVLPLVGVGVVVGVFVIGAALDRWFSDSHAHNRARDARWLARHTPPSDAPDTPDVRDDMSA